MWALSGGVGGGAPALAPETLERHFEAILENTTVDGELEAIPRFTDAGVLDDRQDLLDAYGREPPTTRAEMAAIAEEVQNAERAAGNQRMVASIFQGDAREGRTCNAPEWVDSCGGRIVDEAASRIGRLSPRGGGLVEAEEEAAVVDGASPFGVGARVSCR